MTIKNKLKSVLVEKGMFADQAEEVLQEFIPKLEKSTINFSTLWNTPAEDLLKEVYDEIWLDLKKFTREWIEKNKPQSWFRRAFD